MGIKHYQSQTGDTGRDILTAVIFLLNLIGARRTTILALLAGGLVMGEVTGVSNTIRQQTSNLFMTPPDQGGALQSLHYHLRTVCHPDGENMQ